MKADTTRFAPTYHRSPGQYLELVLTSRGIKKVDFASYCGRTTKLISEILSGKAPITPETAIQFERVLVDIPASTWLNYEAQYRLALQKETETKVFQKYADWLKKFPVRSLAELGYPVNLDSTTNNVQNLLRFFGVASVEAWEKVSAQRGNNIAFRQSNAFKVNPYAVHAWLRVGELEAQNIDAAPYDEKCFRQALVEIRKLTNVDWPHFKEDLQEKCAKCGVAVVIIGSFPNTGLSGAAQWINKDKAAIHLSDMYKSNDHFWFSFYHEAAHILLHSKKNIYIDENSSSTLNDEKEANNFAEKILIPDSYWRDFFRKHPEKKGRFSEKNIRAFASELGISPSIVLGQAQHRKCLPQKTPLNKKLRKSFRISSGT